MEITMEKASIIPILEERGIDYKDNRGMLQIEADSETIGQIVSELEQMDYICDTDNPMASLMQGIFASKGFRIAKENPTMLMIMENLDMEKGYLTLEKCED